MGRLILKCLAGALGGFLGWMILEPSHPSLEKMSEWSIWEIKIVFLTSLLIGGLIGLVDGILKGGVGPVWRGLGLGALFGAICGPAGHQLAGLVGLPLLPFTAAGLPGQMVWRTAVLATIGTVLGGGIGLSSLIPRKGIQGLIGGAIGGGIGGFLFDPIAQAISPATIMTSASKVNEGGGASRAVYFVMSGALIGLFIGIIEVVQKQAWLRRELGRNEGKDYPLDSTENHIGRSEWAAVSIFDDKAVAPMHACITSNKRVYHLYSSGQGETYLNNHLLPPNQPAGLQPGDVIRVGTTQLIFNVKGAKNAPKVATQGPLRQSQLAPGTPSTLIQGPAQPINLGTPAAPSWRLVAEDGPLQGQVFPVSSVMEVGRELPAISLGWDNRTSRRHAKLEPTPTGLAVTDLGSTNGIFVNANKTPQAMLQKGDKVMIGSTTFRVEA
ncbi:MAG: FHA domain-containing protein [Armatimonadetes bacterium]|nr:FHA domain-containing protein [Armatimonadota bacterium]